MHQQNKGTGIILLEIIEIKESIKRNKNISNEQTNF